MLECVFCADHSGAGNAGLAKELPTIIPGPLIQDPQPYTLVTPYGVKVLQDFRRLGMQLDGAARPWSSYS
jgi:hypothetical protein